MTSEDVMASWQATPAAPASATAVGPPASAASAATSALLGVPSAAAVAARRLSTSQALAAARAQNAEAQAASMLVLAEANDNQREAAAKAAKRQSVQLSIQLPVADGRRTSSFGRRSSQLNPQAPNPLAGHHARPAAALASRRTSVQAAPLTVAGQAKRNSVLQTGGGGGGGFPRIVIDAADDEGESTSAPLAPLRRLSHMVKTVTAASGPSGGAPADDDNLAPIGGRRSSAAVYAQIGVGKPRRGSRLVASALGPAAIRPKNWVRGDAKKGAATLGLPQARRTLSLTPAQLAASAASASAGGARRAGRGSGLPSLEEDASTDVYIVVDAAAAARDAEEEAEAAAASPFAITVSPASRRVSVSLAPATGGGRRASSRLSISAAGGARRPSSSLRRPSAADAGGLGLSAPGQRQRAPSAVAFEQHLRLDSTQARTMMRDQLRQATERAKAKRKAAAANKAGATLAVPCPSGKLCSVDGCDEQRCQDGNGYCSTHLDEHRHGVQLRHKRSKSILARILGGPAQPASPSAGVGVGAGAALSPRRGGMGRMNRRVTGLEHTMAALGIGKTSGQAMKHAAERMAASDGGDSIYGAKAAGQFARGTNALDRSGVVSSIYDEHDEAPTERAHEAMVQAEERHNALVGDRAAATAARASFSIPTQVVGAAHVAQSVSTSVATADPSRSHHQVFDTHELRLPFAAPRDGDAASFAADVAAALRGFNRARCASAEGAVAAFLAALLHLALCTQRREGFEATLVDGAEDHAPLADTTTTTTSSSRSGGDGGDGASAEAGQEAAASAAASLLLGGPAVASPSARLGGLKAQARQRKEEAAAHRESRATEQRWKALEAGAWANVTSLVHDTQLSALADLPAAAAARAERFLPGTHRDHHDARVFSEADQAGIVGCAAPAGFARLSSFFWKPVHEGRALAFPRLAVQLARLHKGHHSETDQATVLVHSQQSAFPLSVKVRRMFTGEWRVQHWFNLLK